MNFWVFLLDNEPNELERDFFSASHASKERLFSAEIKFPMKNFLDLEQKLWFFNFEKFFEMKIAEKSKGR